MKILLSWLKEFIAIEESPEEIAAVLTLAGLEVDAIENIQPLFQNVVAAKILEAMPHPNAEKLQIATVTDGRNSFQVVCGAPNCRAGLSTALAMEGGFVVDAASNKAFKIKKAPIRGVESEGMLCSEKELGIGEGHEGIIELDPSIALGTDLRSFFSDVSFEISLTPNLGHCMSVLGVARELAAMLDREVRMPAYKLSESPSRAEEIFSVHIDNPDLCPHYAIRIIENIEVKASPLWLKMRLEASGYRSINNVVDTTNYVMLEYGQPMHAFDKDKIHGRKLRAGPVKKAAPFVSLDDHERELPEGSLAISDEKGPLAIAGIMGGKESSVSESTRSIVLEAAYFNPSSVRQTSKRLGLRSESSSRFEKEIDPLGIRPALDRAAHLLQEMAQCDVLQDIVESCPLPFEAREISCSAREVNRILGTRLGLSEIENLLGRLAIPIKKEDDESFIVSIPSYRNDIKSAIDLIEEIARIYGFNNIERKPLKPSISTIAADPFFTFIETARESLLREGLQEFLTCDLISPREAGFPSFDPFRKMHSLRVLHPSSVDQSLLRTSLMPGLLKTAKQNQDFKCDAISAFEIGLIHYQNPENAVVEEQTAAILLMGPSSPPFWGEKPKEADFFDLKGYIENLFEFLKIPAPSFSPSQSEALHPKKQAVFSLEKNAIGILGEVHPYLLRELDIKNTVFFGQINLHELFKFRAGETQMEPLPQYPGTERDWTLGLRTQLPIEEVFSAIESCKSPLLKKVYLIDLFESEKIGRERKNATFRFLYRDDTKTLSMEMAEKAHDQIQTSVKTQLKEALFEN